MYHARDAEYYQWEVNDFYDVSEKLRRLAGKIRDDVTSYEDVEMYMDEVMVVLMKRQNRIFRVLAREIRSLRKQLERR